jgi:hypothetical protein
MLGKMGIPSDLGLEWKQVTFMQVIYKFWKRLSAGSPISSNMQFLRLKQDCLLTLHSSTAKVLWVQCGRKIVKSFLELFEIMRNKAKEPVELVVIRAMRCLFESYHVFFLIYIYIYIEPSILNCWPHPKTFTCRRLFRMNLS